MKLTIMIKINADNSTLKSNYLNRHMYSRLLRCSVNLTRYKRRTNFRVHAPRPNCVPRERAAASATIQGPPRRRARGPVGSVGARSAFRKDPPTSEQPRAAPPRAGRHLSIRLALRKARAAGGGDLKVKCAAKFRGSGKDPARPSLRRSYRRTRRRGQISPAIREPIYSRKGGSQSRANAI